MGKARQRKQQIRKIIETLSSAEFQAHIQKTLMGIPPRFYQPLIADLIHNAREGVTNKWFV
ncbi:hypothetical protein SD81_032300 [Tolypothrix campylonemoides VB511288]|nr:hypothetical protein SD81_032300 [Tolypothrix campylonemoides VB511288]